VLFYDQLLQGESGFDLIDHFDAGNFPTWSAPQIRGFSTSMGRTTLGLTIACAIASSVARRRLSHQGLDAHGEVSLRGLVNETFFLFYHKFNVHAKLVL
jgi:hypothetical protein